jgi:hypothetical protein
METYHYQFQVRSSVGGVTQCKVAVSEVGEDEKVTLTIGELAFSEIASDAFEAFARLRKIMAQHGITPLCYGASRNVFPSGMSRSMGGGIEAYRLTMGKQALPKDLVCIFDSGPDIEPVLPEEQRAYFESWLSSLGKV